MTARTETLPNGRAATAEEVAADKANLDFVATRSVKVLGPSLDTLDERCFKVLVWQRDRNAAVVDKLALPVVTPTGQRVQWRFAETPGDIVCVQARIDKVALKRRYTADQWLWMFLYGLCIAMVSYLIYEFFQRAEL